MRGRKERRGRRGGGIERRAVNDENRVAARVPSLTHVIAVVGLSTDAARLNLRHKK